MSKSELHDWECEIEELSGNNADKMLGIARDIYKTAFVRGRNSMTWEQTRWIPVSERLPENKETVLVTFKHFISGNTIGLASVILLRGKPLWHVREQGRGTYDVLAWMPLPEPYKEEMEGEE